MSISTRSRGCLAAAWSERLREDFDRPAWGQPPILRFPKTGRLTWLKSILGIVVGYIVMAFTAFTLFTCAYLGLGVDRVFESDSYAVSMLWIVLMIVITLVCGILGGLTCAAISKSKKTCLVFVGIVFVLSLVFAIP